MKVDQTVMQFRLELAIVLRKKAQAEINLYYLFRALRSDHFTR
jgi:hypothetical protein